VLLIVILAAINAVHDQSGYYANPVIMMIWCALLAGQILFYNDDKNRLDIMYGTLGFSRRGVVFGRYSSGMVIGLGGLVVALVVSLIGAGVRGESIVWPVYWLIVAASFLIFCFQCGLAMLLFFVLGFARGRIANVLLAMVPLLGFILLNTNSAQALARFLGWVPNWLFGIGMVVLGCALLALFISIASRVYARRDLL
jgi:hypothetical protein